MIKRGPKAGRRIPAPARGLAEQLDRALQAMLAGRTPAPLAAGLTPLLQIAAGLRGLPRAEFKARLAAELAAAHPSRPDAKRRLRKKEGGKMPVSKGRAVKPVAQNLDPVMPFMYIREPAAAVEFYRTVLGARVLMREAEPGGVLSHAQFQIGESRFMIANPASRHLSEYARAGWARTPRDLGGTPVHLYVQVADVDRVFGKALAAGAQVVHEVRDMEWGDRVGGFQDPYGHVWYVATPVRRRVQPDN
jgi:PhnB protein